MRLSPKFTHSAVPKGTTLTHAEAAAEFGVSSHQLARDLQFDPNSPARLPQSAAKNPPRYNAAQIRKWWGARKT